MSDTATHQMRSLLLLFSLLNVSSVYAQTPTPIPSESGSFAGDLDITPSNEEAIHINFQYGPLPELDQNPGQTISALSDNLNALEEATQVEKTALYFVPEGSDSPDFPEELLRRTHAQKVVVPRSLIAGFKEVFRNSYVRPTPTEKTMGIVFGTVRATISGIVWFSAPGVSPELATLMTLSIGAVSGFNNVYNQTLNNLFAYGLRERTTTLGRAYNSSVIIARSMAYDFTFSNLLNVFSGMRNSFAQNATNFVASGALGQVAGAQRTAMLTGRRHLNISYTLLLAPLTYTISALESTGQLHAVFNVGFYAVRPTMLATVAIYTGLIVANHFAKDKIIGLLTKVDERVGRLINRISSKFTRVTEGFCENTMSGDDHALQN